MFMSSIIKPELILWHGNESFLIGYTHFLIIDIIIKVKTKEPTLTSTSDYWSVQY